ncbi:MAG: ABC-2 family transporter protein [Actinomycetota bacterium]
MTARATWWRTWAMAWRAAAANRRGFFTQITMMVVNDAVWLVFWLIVFRQVVEIRGWRFDDVLVLFAILTTSAGAVLGAMHNARQIGHLAWSGELDAVLGLPVAPLPHLLLRRVETLFVGDLAFGIVLFALFGNPTPARVATFVFGVVCAVAVLTGFLVAAGSTAFFVDRNEAGEMGFHGLLLFSSYPIDIFAGATKFVLYVVVPAGFVSSVPARLVAEFDLRWAAASAAAELLFALGGVVMFRLGLRRYTSGSTWV